MKLFKVGGAVRDYFLNLQPKDVDFAVEGFQSFDEMVEALKTHGVEIATLHREFFTARGRHLGEYHDYVWCRKDGLYINGDLQEVFPGTIHDDLARRDFTINAMAISLDTGELLDPFNGMEDLNSRYLRCVGSPQVRFREHPIRMARAIRFAVKLGLTVDLQIEECFQDPELLDFLSWPKFLDLRRSELNKAFAFDTESSIRTLGKYPELSSALLAGLRAQFTSKGKIRK